MKTFIRVFLVLCVLVVLLAGAAYFALTRPAIQKKIIESKLPPGSSIQFVHITTGRLELNDVKLQLPDGTAAKFDSLHSDFAPMAAIFDNTVQLRGLKLDGLLIKLPEPSAASVVASPTTGTSSTPPGKPPSAVKAPEPVSEEPSSSIDAFYSLGDLDFLFDIDSIDLNGALIDAERNRYSFDIASDRIAPGAETTVEAALKLDSKQALQGGLKDFTSDARLVFTQKTSGGFEQLRLKSETSGSDAEGATLLSLSQTLELSLQSFEKSAEVALAFSADLPRPEIFAPELVQLQGLALQGQLQGRAEGDALTLQTADLEAQAKGSKLASVKLKQNLNVGAEQKFSGELMQVNLFELPLAWLNPWLGGDLQISGAPLSAQITLSGEENGALAVKTATPLQVGPFSFAQNQQVLLKEVTLQMEPYVRIDADQTIYFDMRDLQVLDPGGTLLSGNFSGSRRDSADRSPLAGLSVEAQLQLALLELLQQPVLAGMTSVLAGEAEVELDIEGSAEYPAKLQLRIAGLRARDLPGAQQDYHLAAQLKQPDGATYALGSKLQAGSGARPSTDLQLAGQVQLEKQPVPFKVNLTGARVSQGDIDLLLAALKPQETRVDATPAQSTATQNTSTTRLNRQSTSTAYPTSQSEASMTQRPPWANFDGDVTVQLDALTLKSGQTITGLRAQAKISEPLLSVRELAAQIEEGALSGNAEVKYDSSLSKAYQVSTALSFENVDPTIFSKQSSNSFPVKGTFDGQLQLVGDGDSLEQALEDSDAELQVTGHDGVLTAFELDERSELGLMGAGLLGKSLDRPGLTALAKAVPYFKDIKFEDFALKLLRAQDKKIRIPELKFIGDNLRLAGQGQIAASRFSEVLEQPLDLTLGLGAKGGLIDSLETLGLLGSDTGEDGFRHWNKEIHIGGTLSAPDTEDLKELLNGAARRVFEKPEKSKTSAAEATSDKEAATDSQQKSETEASETPKKKTKREKRRDDVEMGIDLLNSVFGSK